MREDFDHYDLGYQFIGFDEVKLVIVELNYSANVMLMTDINFDMYKMGLSCSYYGGYAQQSPVRLKIPFGGHWHVVVDNGGDPMLGIRSSCSVRTIGGY